MVKMNKITKFGKAPLNKHVLILNRDKNWGHGYFFKWEEDSCGEKADGKIYCNFYSPEQTWLGESKESFLGWIEFPESSTSSAMRGRLTKTLIPRENVTANRIGCMNLLGNFLL
jgi:hypothetical protein